MCQTIVFILFDVCSLSPGDQRGRSEGPGIRACLAQGAYPWGGQAGTPTLAHSPLSEAVPGRLQERGWNGVELMSVRDCWVRQPPPASLPQPPQDHAAGCMPAAAGARCSCSGRMHSPPSPSPLTAPAPLLALPSRCALPLPLRSLAHPPPPPPACHPLPPPLCSFRSATSRSSTLIREWWSTGWLPPLPSPASASLTPRPAPTPSPIASTRTPAPTGTGG